MSSFAFLWPVFFARRLPGSATLSLLAHSLCSFAVVAAKGALHAWAGAFSDLQCCGNNLSLVGFPGKMKMYDSKINVYFLGKV